MPKVQNKIKLIDAPIYSYKEALYKCFYSLRLYLDVGKRWPGIGLLYLLFAIAVYSIPFAIRVTHELNQSFKEHIVEPLMALPLSYVQNGELSFDKPMPYFIRNKKNQVVLIVDTTGAVTKFTSKYPSLSILVNKERIQLKIPSPQLFANFVPDVNTGDPLTQEYGKNSNFALDGKKIVEDNNMQRFDYLSAFLIYPLVITIFYSMTVILFLVFAFLGQVFSQILFSFSLSFKQSCRLFMVACTPSLALLILLLTFDSMFFGSGYLLLIIAVIYYSLGVSVLKADSQKVVKS